MEHLQHFMATTGQLLLSGAAGGLVRWLTLKQGWRDGLISVAVGSLLALYLGPFAVGWLAQLVPFVGATPESAIGLGGFLVGIGGIVVSGFVIDLWQLRGRLVRDQNKGGSNG